MSFLRFFMKMPGLLIPIIGVILASCFYAKKYQDEARAEAQKRQVHRDLGQVNPQTPVDRSQAPKEAIISNQKLNPIQPGAEPAATPSPAPAKQPAPTAPAAPVASSFVFYEAPAPTPTPTPEPEPQKPKAPRVWLPRGMFIPCALVNTIESSHLNTPVVGEVVQDVYQINDGVRHLIIPAGTLVNCWANPGATRDRIEVAGNWSLTFSDGRECTVEGVACTRQANASNRQFGPEDGSAGLMGELVESDHWANLKALTALLFQSLLSTGQTAATALVQAQRTGVSFQLPDTTGFLEKYMDQLLEGKSGDARFVRVLAGTEFYLYPASVVEPALRDIGGQKSRHEESNSSASPSSAPSDSVGQALEIEREILRSQQNQSQQEKKDEDRPARYHF